MGGFLYYYQGFSYQDVLNMPIHRYRDLLLYRVNTQEKMDRALRNEETPISKEKKWYSFGVQVE